MRIAKGKNADIIQIADNQIITILKNDKPYPSFRPLKSVKYKVWITLKDFEEISNHIKEQGYINGGNKDEQS